MCLCMYVLYSIISRIDGMHQPTTCTASNHTSPGKRRGLDMLDRGMEVLVRRREILYIGRSQPPTSATRRGFPSDLQDLPLSIGVPRAENSSVSGSRRGSILHGVDKRPSFYFLPPCFCPSFDPSFDQFSASRHDVAYIPAGRAGKYGKINGFGGHA